MIGSERIGGAALIAAGAGTVLAMAHHPTHIHAGHMNQLVHGFALPFLALSAFGFASFAAARGAARPAILAGAVCYAVALFGDAGAATINGFVVPALAARGETIGRDIFLFAWETNQALAALGVVAASFAILFWSADLVARGGREPRLVGAFGVAAGGVPLVLLLAGVTNMHLAGAFFAYACHAAWGTALGVHLLRKNGQPASS